jgi:hypothetical protein
MAPAKDFAVSLLRKAFISAGCPFPRVQPATRETWPPQFSNVTLLPQRSDFRWMSIPSDENRHDGSMAHLNSLMLYCIFATAKVHCLSP